MQRKIHVSENAEVGDSLQLQAIVDQERFSASEEPENGVPVQIDYRRFDEFLLRAELKDFEGYVDFDAVIALAKFNADRVFGRMRVIDADVPPEEEE